MSSTDTAGLVDGRFYLERRVGSGGAGTVYRARDELDGAIVALKIMVSDWDDTSRFTREAEILADLRHPGIVRHVAHGTTAEGAPYVAMEWLEGADLSEVLAQRKLHPSQCLTLARRVAEALGFAHARGIVHRDVKPGNLFVVEDDVERVKLIDFGIARVSRADQTLTRTGMILGSGAM